MYKHFFFVLLFIGIFSFLLPFKASAESLDLPKDISAHAAVLMVQQTGEVLYAKNENEKLPMASTTKIMTSILALESGKQQQEFIVEPHMIQVEGSSMGLLPGDQITLENLVCGMLLESGNDAAQATAYAVSGGIEPFLKCMNQKAKALHLNNTHFASVSGLDATEHYSTAYDMAKLASYALSNPQFKAICSKPSMRVAYGNPPYQRTLKNHNKLLKQYEGAIGVKTGFTKKSGRCLVSAAERDGISLICVTLNARKDWEDHQKLLDYGFSLVNWEEIPMNRKDFSVPVVGGKKETISLQPQHVLRLPKTTQSTSFTWKVYKEPFLYAPIEKDRSVGKVVFYREGKKISEIPLLTMESVEKL